MIPGLALYISPGEYPLEAITAQHPLDPVDNVAVPALPLPAAPGKTVESLLAAELADFDEV